MDPVGVVQTEICKTRGNAGNRDLAAFSLRRKVNFIRELRQLKTSLPNTGDSKMKMNKLTKTLCAAAVAGLVAIPFSTAHAWGGWGPMGGNNWGNDWGPFDGSGDGSGDFDMSWSGRGSGSGRGQGYGRGYGYGDGYGYGGPGYGYGPYGGGPYGGGPYGAPYGGGYGGAPYGGAPYGGAPYGAPPAPVAPPVGGAR